MKALKQLVEERKLITAAIRQMPSKQPTTDTVEKPAPALQHKTEALQVVMPPKNVVATAG